eukprot:SAG31_NODE_1834_length_7135_cov_6.903923_7_plen_144_part_00
MGVAPTIQTTVWATAGQRYNPQDKKYDNEPFLKWLVNVTSRPNSELPHVFTISYQDFEDTLTPAFMDRVSDEIARLAIRGITVSTGSGDWGVGCTADANFRGDFPSSSPYVVSVGATTFTGDQASVQAGAEVGIHFMMHYDTL